MSHSDHKPPHVPNAIEAFGVWLKIGLLSFGGPAGQIALMYRILVEERSDGLEKKGSPHALNYCMLLPGPEAQQLATYIGWLLTKQRAVWWQACYLFCQAAAVIFALSWIYVVFNDVPFVEAFIHRNKGRGFSRGY